MPGNDKYDQFEALRRKTNDEYNSLESSFGYSRGVIMIIWTLSDFKHPCTQKEICADWCESKQTINSAAKKLEAEGIINIVPSPDNFREKLLVLTEKGNNLASKTVEKLLKAERAAFARLSDDEQDELIRISQKHYDFIKEEFTKIKEVSQ